MKKNGPGFIPEEIIFCPTSICNLKCSHCYVKQKNEQLNINDSLVFLEDCAKNIDFLKIGFSGGEPFLNLDFVTTICKKSIELELIFDRLMTNGIWWNTKEELKNKISLLYNSGFDGKIGISFDKFHGNKIEKILDFISASYQTFNNKNCIEILSVVDSKNVKQDTKDFLILIKKIKEKFSWTKTSFNINKKNGVGSIILTDLEGNNLVIYRFAQSIIPEDEIQLNDKKWFTEDYCQFTGNVFYIHSDGNIAPCCGFANERKELFIGNIKNDYKTLIDNASKNSIVKICFTYGLKQKVRELQKQKKLSKGKSFDMCNLCYCFCKNYINC